MGASRRFNKFLDRFFSEFSKDFIYKCFALFSYVLKRETKKIVSKNVDIKSLKTSDFAILAATGPSVKDFDPRLASKFDVFSVSNFFLHDEIEIFSPLVHFFAAWHPPLDLNNYVEWLKKADQTLPKSTSIAIDSRMYALVTTNLIFADRSVYYIWTEKAQIGELPDLTRPVMRPQSGPLLILPALIYMGYKKIYLLGCDHNILKNYGGTVHNFYSADKEARVNATSGSNWDLGIFAHLIFALNVFKQYEFYKKIIAKTDVEVVNLSTESWLECFPKGSIDD